MKTKTNFKILLIAINNVWRYGNVGIDQLTGYLRKRGFIVELIHFDKKATIETILKNIEFTYDFYGFSVTSANYSMFCNLSQIIKERNPKAIIEFGGGLVSRYYREIFSECPYVDFMTLGDGEIPTEILLNSLINNDKSYQSHYAIVERGKYSDKRNFLNTEINYYPAFDYFENDTPFRNSRKTLCLQTKNNVCTGNCSFCTERHGKVFYKDLDFIVDEIKYVNEKFGIKKIFFSDDNILDPNNEEAKDRLFLLCNKLKNSGLKMAYQCYMKAISLQDTEKDNQLLQLMKETGFVEVFVGLESGNQEDLDLYNKHTKVEDNYTIINLLRKHKLFPIIGFINFNPYSTFEKIEKNFKFLLDVECTYLYNYIYTFVNINKYTDLYDKICKDQLILSSPYDYINIKYDFVDKKTKELLLYVNNEMIPTLKKIEYDVDWVTYSYLEHKIWYENIICFDDELEIMRKKSLNLIRKYLSIIFIDHDIQKFDSIKNDFWNYFFEQENRLKEIYSYLISLHRNDRDPT